MATTAQYRLLSRAGYKFNLARIGDPLPTSTTNKLDYPDILIERPGTPTDYELIHEQSLITINGLVYNTHYDELEDKLYVPNATENMIISRNNNLGIISFVGHHSPIGKIPITEDMLYGQHNTPLRDKCYIDLSNDQGTGIGNHFLVLAGYLIFEEEDLLYRVSPDQVVVKLNRLGLRRKILELAKYTDILSKLGLPNHTNSKNLIDDDDIDDEVIKKLLTLPNSFIVTFYGSRISTHKRYLEYSNIPGTFRTETRPWLPLIIGDGKIAEYAHTKGAGEKYNVTVADTVYHNYIYGYHTDSEISKFNNSRDPNKNYFLTRAYFLDIIIR